MDRHLGGLAQPPFVQPLAIDSASVGKAQRHATERFCADIASSAFYAASRIQKGHGSGPVTG